MRVDCPPVCRPALADPAVPLFITEGQKKADALASRGACAIALLGVWNFKGRNDFGGATLLADFDYIAFDNRPVYLVFDSDVMTKAGVRQALDRLAEHLKRKRAMVSVVYLPRLDNGKTGVDDWFVATGKGVKDLVALAEGPRPELKPAPATVSLLKEAPARMTRPLALIDGRAYAATWLWVRTTLSEKLGRNGEIVRLDPPQTTEEWRLAVLRDSGEIFLDDGGRSLREAGVAVTLKETIPAGMCLSVAGVTAWRNGYRPDPADVFQRVCDCVDRFIDFDRSLADQRTMTEMVACYIMATWFLDAFTVAGNLWPNGDRGSGKTQLLSVVAQMAYLGRVVLGGGSFAALRDLADYGATLAFDDAENLADPRRTDPDKRALLLAGNRRGNSVPVKEKTESGWQTRYINTFSFRLFSATQLPDPILASRTIVVPLIRTPDRYRANADPEDTALWPHDRRKLVDDLWLMALAHLPELGPYQAAINSQSTLTGRALEPWRALLATAAWLAGLERPQTARLLHRMMALSVAYQKERPNVEADDLTAVVIRALGMILGKMIKDDSGISGISDRSGIRNKGYFLPTQLITAAAHAIVEAHEMDIDVDKLTPRRIAPLLKKMRLVPHKQPNGGKRGWMVSIDILSKWALAYSLNIEEITGIECPTQERNAAIAANAANAAIAPSPHALVTGDAP